MPSTLTIAPTVNAAAKNPCEFGDPRPSKIGKEIAARYPGSTLCLGGRPLNGGYVTLSLIKVSGLSRNEGIGTKLMTDLINVADEMGWNLALTPSNGFGSSVARLKKFYKSFGFVENRGRNKDFLTMESMIRRSNSLYIL
jgi:GNAT superfamily N-acetyltransferase